MSLATDVPAPTKAPIRVLHVIDSFQTGGKERQLVELLKGLKSHDGVACEVVTMSKRVDFPEIHSLAPIHVVLRRSRYDPRVISRLLRIVRERKIDIVHSWNSMCSIYAAPVARLAGAKFVNGYVRAAIPGLNWRDADYFRGKLTVPFSDAVVANSRAGLNAYAVPAGKAVCVYNGFDAARLEGLQSEQQARQSLGIDTRYVVGMVASFSIYKDHDTFFAMARRLIAARDDVTIVTVGGGNNPTLGPELAAAANSGRLKLLGRRTDVEDIVNTFTVGVLTSTVGEGFSNVVMEYMALGKPVVATDRGGNSELIVEGETGFLIPERDEPALTDRVTRLLDNPELARECGEAGQARVESMFNLDRMTHAYCDLYDRLLHRN